jgi:SAM-dependent methyltransferase
MPSPDELCTDEFDRVRRYFTRSAASFDSLYSLDTMSPLMRLVNRTFRRDMYERFLLSMAHVRTHGLKTALDVGCGSGRYVAALAELGMERIVGVDSSTTMVALAQDNIRRSGAPGAVVELVCADFMAYATSAQFDVVLAMGFFDYVRDPIPVLRRMGALALHSVVASFPSISVYRTPIRKVRYVFKRCPVYFYTRRKIRALGVESGFPRTTIVKIRGSGQDYFVTFLK